MRRATRAALGLTLPALLAGAGLAVLGCAAEPPASAPPATAAVPLPTFEVVKTEAEWQAQLTPEAYAVLRQQATEPASTGTMWSQTDAGTYHCGACGRPLFPSTAKYDAQNGWPSFTAPIAREAVVGVPDLSFGMERTRILCSRCGSHLGYLFGDGPNEPEHNRFTINSSSLVFVAEGGELPADFGKPRPPGDDAAPAPAEPSSPEPAAAPPAAEPAPPAADAPPPSAGAP